MRRFLMIVFYVTITLVVLSEARTVWLALAERQRFIDYLPPVAGASLPVFVATSAAAGLNAVLVGARVRWAVWLNIAIGVWSIFLLEIIGAPQANAWIVAIACAVTAGVPFLTWMRDPRETHD
ncbi:MAG: hypothetical protein ACJ8FT_09095 [Sphingomonas sp.]